MSNDETSDSSEMPSVGSMIVMTVIACMVYYSYKENTTREWQQKNTYMVCFPSHEFPNGHRVANPLMITLPTAGDAIVCEAVRGQDKCYVYLANTDGAQALMVRREDDGTWFDLYGPVEIPCPADMTCDLIMTWEKDSCCPVPKDNILPQKRVTTSSL